MNKFDIAVIIALVVAGTIGVFIGRYSIFPLKETESKYFVNESGKYLNEIRLDLPEEISTVIQESDSTVDLMTAYLDTKRGIIYLGFTGMRMYKNDWQYLNEDEKPCKVIPISYAENTQFLQGGDIEKDMLKMYQVELEMDSLNLFDHGRFIGKVPYSNSPLDSLFIVDSQ